jgi:uncharacterized protein (TIGR02231 family)
MHFPKILILLVSAFITFTASAQSFESKVSEVILYKTKARETRQLSISVNDKGRQEWILTNISKNIDPASLQVTVNGARLITASTRLNYLAPNPFSQQIKNWQDSLEKTEDQLTWVREQLAVYQGEIKLLQEIIKVDGDETSVYAKTTEEMLNLYRNRSLKVRESYIDLMKKEKELQKLINNLKQQISQSGGGQTQAIQEIVLVTEVKQPGKVLITCTYLVNGSGWTPSYNLRAQSLQQPIQIEMLADIRQNTGYDWENVQLSLSTSDPSANQTRPLMSPLYIDFYRGVQLEESVKRLQGVAATNMAYSARALKSSDNDGVQDAELFYSIEPVESPVAQMYILPGLQKIRSGSEGYQLTINTINASAEMMYHTVPKKDLTAFLIARIPQWEQYNLLQGKASIFFEDTYVGNTIINPKVANDTLLLSMGRDDLIQIDRTAVKDVTSTKWLGGSKKEVKTFEISVRNNKKSDIRIEVLDQIPVSRQKDIEVVLESADGAEYIPENGRLRWLLDLKPGEVRKLRFSFSYKYPANQQVIMGN